MTDTPHKKRDDKIHIAVDGGVSVSKQAIWRTVIIILTLFTGGGVVATKVENATMREQLAAIRTELTDTSARTTKELGIFKSVMDDVVNFLVEEKAQQKTKDGKKRYEEQIEKIRTKLKPISQAQPEPFAGGDTLLPKER